VVVGFFKSAAGDEDKQLWGGGTQTRGHGSRAKEPREKEKNKKGREKEPLEEPLEEPLAAAAAAHLQAYVRDGAAARVLRLLPVAQIVPV
jgi:hypothetical protein